MICYIWSTLETLKTILCSAAHTRVGNIRKSPAPDNSCRCCSQYFEKNEVGIVTSPKWFLLRVFWYKKRNDKHCTFCTSTCILKTMVHCSLCTDSTSSHEGGGVYTQARYTVVPFFPRKNSTSQSFLAASSLTFLLFCPCCCCCFLLLWRSSKDLVHRLFSKVCSPFDRFACVLPFYVASVVFDLSVNPLPC